MNAMIMFTESQRMQESRLLCACLFFPRHDFRQCKPQFNT